MTRIKEQLGISWRPLLDLLDYPDRTFFAHRKIDILPDKPGLGQAVRLLSTLVDEDSHAVGVLIAGRKDEVKRLIGENKLGTIRELFARTRREMAHGEAVRDPVATVSKHLDALRRIVAEPDFAIAAEAIEEYTSRSGNQAADRMLASVELESALRSAHEGDDLDPSWEFLPVLTFAAMDALRARAQAFVTSKEFTKEAWRALVAREQEAAWAAYGPLVLPPDPVQPAPASGGSSRRHRGPSYTDRLSR